MIKNFVRCDIVKTGEAIRILNINSKGEKIMEQKKLMRSIDNRMVCGVCGGIGNYFNVDPTLIRLVWVLASFFGGSGLLVYIIAAIIIPEE